MTPRPSHGAPAARLGEILPGPRTLRYAVSFALLGALVLSAAISA